MKKRYIFNPILKRMVLVDLLRQKSTPTVRIDTKAKDPTCADVAVPRAFRELERTHSAAKIAKDAGHSIDTIKRTWGI